MRKPNIFIGSSSEALPFAEQVVDNLGDQVEATIWNDRLFTFGEDHLTSLLRCIRAFDFALLLVTPDDALETRDKKVMAPRDNVVFELGLFMGALGRRRAFPVMIYQNYETPKIPSDLAGQNIVNLIRTQKRLTKKAKAEVAYLGEEIDRRHQQEAEFQLLPSTGIAVSYFYNFLVPVCKLLSGRSEVTTYQNEKEQLDYDDFRFQILLPGSIRDANPSGADHHVRNLNLVGVVVGKTTGHRPYPFYLDANASSDRVLVFTDYPTVLKASDEAVDHVTRDAYLSVGGMREVLEARELANFRNTISLLLDDYDDAIAFRSKVEFLELR